VSRDTNDFMDGKNRAPEIDYAHPDYYLQDVPVPPHAASLASSQEDTFSYLPEYSEIPYEYRAYSPYVDEQGMDNLSMREYRHPGEIAGYTADIGAEQREIATRRQADKKKKRKGLAGLGGIGATLAALLLKLQGLAFLLKFGIAGITALVSVAIYAFFLGWPFAIGLVVLLFIHEMGHAVVMKLKGIPVGGLIFIPMLGAAVTMRRMPQNARDEAEVGIAGPMAGTIAASACLLLAQFNPQSSTLWPSLAYFGFFMNLFNLIPIVPFDGGRVLAAIDRRIWIIGFLGLLAFQIWSWLHGDTSIWLLFFIAMAATQLWSRGIASASAQARAYYDVPVGTRIILSLAYFGLAAVLVLGMSISHGMLPVFN
jgi:Zn-dependent protease